MKNPKKQTDFRGDTGRILIDFGKLVFGSMFLGGMLRGEIPQVMMVAGGFITTVVFCFVGLWLTSKNRRAGDKIKSPL